MSSVILDKSLKLNTTCIYSQHQVEDDTGIYFGSVQNTSLQVDLYRN